MSEELYTAAEKKLMLDVARRAISSQLEGRSCALPDTIPNHLLQIGSCFVTLRMDGELRGCIGSLEAHEPLIDNIASNAKGAAFRDPRFPPLSAEEFALLDIHISVLTPAVPVESYQDIVLGRHGVILESQGHRSVFLPEVAVEQGWDTVTMLEYLSRKAGLDSHAWQEAEFQVFESICFGDEDV